MPALPPRTRWLRADAASPSRARASAGRRPSSRARRATRTPACGGAAHTSAACAQEPTSSAERDARERIVAHGAGAHALREQRRLERVRLVLQHQRARDDEAALRLQRLDRLCQLSLECQQVLLRVAELAPRGRAQHAQPGAHRHRLLHRVGVEIHLARNQLKVSFAQHRVQLVQVRRHVGGAAPAALVGLQRGCRGALQRAVAAQRRTRRGAKCVSVRWCIRRPLAGGGNARDAAVGLAGLINQGGCVRSCAGALRERGSVARAASRAAPGSNSRLP
jgi:hypothetical protein